jgi:hypothetical protein
MAVVDTAADMAAASTWRVAAIIAADMLASITETATALAARHGKSLRVYADRDTKVGSMDGLKLSSDSREHAAQFSLNRSFQTSIGEGKDSATRDVPVPTKGDWRRAGARVSMRSASPTEPPTWPSHEAALRQSLPG